MKSEDGLIQLIAIFKFLKAGLLIALGIGLFKLLHKDLGDELEHWCEALRLDPANHFVAFALRESDQRESGTSQQTGIRKLSLRRIVHSRGHRSLVAKRWAEWLTVIITSSLVPVELYEIYRHSSYAKVVVLALNVAIVIYLIHHMRKKGAAQRSA
jgi:uncharacterized membrane protein (DUF2068 family)